ncbi:MAG: aldo/keto reductase, partial [Acidimicrobiia bacterium]|nr:aldo/keto reductase [Acidimicrobiia bacterium]
MEQRRFGTTDLMTSAIGFGTWEMSTTMYGDIDVDEASRAVNAAIDRGITLFDTAEVYGPFHSEELLAKAIGNRRDEIVLVTKVGFAYDGTKVTGTDSSYQHVIERTETCLQRLDTDVVDLMLIHWPDHDTPIDETMSALEKLKADGKIRYYGVSNFNVEMMENCQQHGAITANQVGYNLFDRRMEAEVLPWCESNDVGFMSYGSLGFGLLTGTMMADTSFAANDWRGRGTAFGLPLFLPEWMEREVRVADRLKVLAAEHGKSLAQMAISWVLGNSAVTVALVGMRNETELDENVAAAGWQVPDDLRAE